MESLNIPHLADETLIGGSYQTPILEDITHGQRDNSRLYGFYWNLSVDSFETFDGHCVFSHSKFFSALEGYLNSCCIVTVVSMTTVLVVFLLSTVIYIGWWREDLWHEKLIKYNKYQLMKRKKKHAEMYPPEKAWIKFGFEQQFI